VVAVGESGLGVVVIDAAAGPRLSAVVVLGRHDGVARGGPAGSRFPDDDSTKGSKGVLPQAI
jgi:hypothetical protein